MRFEVSLVLDIDLAGMSEHDVKTQLRHAVVDDFIAHVPIMGPLPAVVDDWALMVNTVPKDDE